MTELFEQTLVNMKPLGTYETDSNGDIWNVAVREWVARQIRDRGHHEVTRGMIRRVKFGFDEPWGSEVTPPERQQLSLICELEDKSGGWWTKDGYKRHEESIEWHSPSQLVLECNLIARKLHELGEPE